MNVAAFRTSAFFLLLALALAAASAPATAQQAPSPEAYADLEWRYIGPEGNRFSAAAGLPSDPYTYYVGAASGGIYKTTDGGVNWDAIFDDQPVQSIGSLGVSLTDPNIVWAGTGEGKIRSHISIGQGVYKSTDGGMTWTLMGARTDGAHSPARHPSDQSRHRLRLRAGAFVRSAAGARRLPHHGRRRELGAGALRGREHRVLGHRPRPGQPAQPVRRDVAARDPHLRPHQRRTRRRPARLPRRRRHLGEAQWSRQRHRVAEPAGGEGRGGDRALEHAARLRDARDRRRDSVGRPRDRGRPGLGFDRRRPHLDAHHPQPQRHGPPALLLARGRVARRRGRGVLPDRLLLGLDRRRAAPST